MARKDRAPGDAAPAGGAGEPAGRRRRRCPTCGAATVDKYRPFCSARCADIDLGRWFKGTYRVATEEEPAADTAPPQDED